MTFRTLLRTIAHARYVTWQDKFNIDIFKINAEGRAGWLRGGTEGAGRGQEVRC